MESRSRNIIALAVIAVVPLRNYLVARDPVIFTAHSGINFYYGNNPNAGGTWQPTGELEQSTGFSHDWLKRTARIIDGRLEREYGIRPPRGRRRRSAERFSRPWTPPATPTSRCARPPA